MQHEALIERVRRMELYFDTIHRALQENVNILHDLPLRAMLDVLTAYYDGGQWLSDYEADERGELPPDLKRGVLSQDGVYELFSQIQNREECYHADKRSDSTD